MARPDDGGRIVYHIMLDDVRGITRRHGQWRRPGRRKVDKVTKSRYDKLT